MESRTRCIQTTLPGRPEAATRARRAVRSLSGLIHPDHLDDLELVASELVGNSVRYALTGSPDEAIDLCIVASPGTVRLEVADPGPGFEPEVSKPSDLSQGGRGLFLVAALSHRWGVDRRAGTTVWCELKVATAFHYELSPTLHLQLFQLCANRRGGTAKTGSRKSKAASVNAGHETAQCVEVEG